MYLSNKTEGGFNNFPLFRYFYGTSFGVFKEFAFRKSYMIA